jgi:hypothetical protein
MGEDPSNEAFILSLHEGYGADEAEAMDTEPVPHAEDWRDKYSAWMDRGELSPDTSPGWPSRSPSSTTSCTSVPRRVSGTALGVPLNDGESSLNPGIKTR